MVNLHWKKASKNPLRLALLLVIGTPTQLPKEKNLRKAVKMYQNKGWSVTIEPCEKGQGEVGSGILGLKGEGRI